MKSWNAIEGSTADAIGTIVSRADPPDYRLSHTIFGINPNMLMWQSLPPPLAAFFRSCEERAAFGRHARQSQQCEEFICCSFCNNFPSLSTALKCRSTQMISNRFPSCSEWEHDRFLSAASRAAPRPPGEYLRLLSIRRCLFSRSVASPRWKGS